MRYAITFRLSSALVLALNLGLAGCTRAPSGVPPPEPTTIPVSYPAQREITDFVDFTGRTEAIESVDIRPRTTGYLVKIPFKQGSDVKAGDVLFVIDQRPYQAQLDQAAGQVDLYQAQLKLAKVTLARDLAINVKVPNSISRQQLDQDQASLEAADAQVRAFEKNLEVYKLNQEFTKVISPISGMVSRYYLTIGNLVNQDQTLLTTVVSLDPMYAYFDVDEPTLLRVRKAVNEGKIKPRDSGAILPVFMGLQGDEGFPHEGEIDFINNQLNPTTGSMLVRGVFANPKPPKGVRLLSPGMFVRIRVPIGEPHPAVLVIDPAVQSDQGMKYVYVVDKTNTVQYRRVTTGSLQDDGLRVITQHLNPDERVVVAGLQQVHSQDQIAPELIPMPSLNQPFEEDATSGGKDTEAARAAPAKSKAGP